MATRPRPNSPPHPSDKSGTFTINNNNHSRNSSSRGIGLGLGLEYENEGYHSDAPSEQSQDLARRIKEQERHLKEGRPSSIDMALDMERELESDLEEHEHEHENEQELSHGRDANISGGNKNDIDDDESGLKPESSGTEYLDEVDLIGSNAVLNSNSKDQQQSLPQQQLPQQQQQKQYPNLGKKPGMVDDGSRRVSLDPHVLSAIIANLRADLENATRERDALTAELERVPAREAELREALALLTERAAELEGELAKLRRKSQEDDESIQMLRTKVEESRRGLMRLQTENKRVSMMSLDTGRANSLFGAGPSSSKRTSFTPLTGSGAGRIPGHRRISSVSEPPSLHEFNIGDTASLKLSPSKAGGTISLPDESGQQEDVKKSRRSSAFYAPARSGATSPIFDSQEVSFGDMISASQAQAQVAQAQAQIEALIRERDAAHSLLASTKQELAEAQEAREASEQCVVALRTFISANNVGEDGPPAGGEILKLPPLPTEKNMDDEKHASPPKRPTVGTGWSFGKLWRSDSGGVGGGSSGMTAPVDSVPRRSSSESTSVITPVSSSGPGLSVTGSTPTTPGQSFSRKLGGFFGGRGQSVTSITSVTSYTESAHPPTTHGQQEPIANGLGSDDEGETGEERERGMPSASASVSTGGMSADDGPSEPVSPDIEITNVVVVKDVEETEINTPIARIEHEVEHGVNEKQPTTVVPVPEAASVDSGLV